MKKICYFLLLITIATIYSCKKEDEVSTGIQPVNLIVHLTYALDSSDYALPVKGVTVKITNTSTSSQLTTTANDSGIARFTGIPAGTYDVDASITITADNYYTITGTYTADDITFNASEKNAAIAVGNDLTMNMTLVAGTTGQWVIRQVYFAGSHRTDGALYRDQFIEIHNNSDQVLYADSLYIGQVYGRQSFTSSNYYTLTNGQMDWSRSVNMPADIDANNDFVYTRTLLMIPGTGTTYPVQPGSSIVIAQTAMNHQVPWTGANGTTITVKNPALTVDLSGADFEAYYASFLSTPLASDVDNLSVPNLEVLQYFGNDWILDNNGRDGYVIFKVDGSQTVKNWPMYNFPTTSTPSATAVKYYQVPLKYVIDAVEIQPNTAEDRIPKKFGAQYDAGFAFVPKGAYSSQSAIRKTQKTVNGRVVLKDTNNSTEDFDYFDVATPRGFK
jgi:hypothetical protein